MAQPEPRDHHAGAPAPDHAGATAPDHAGATAPDHAGATAPQLVVGITSRALFDLAEADRVFREQGLAAYREHQRRRESVMLAPGTALPLVRALLRLNRTTGERLVRVVVISRNDADTGVRVFHSIAAHGLDIEQAAFTGGREPWPYLSALRCNLFLSAEPADVQDALERGLPAALVSAPPRDVHDADADEVRIAFDGDAVLFDPASERVYQTEGLEAFHQREAARADQPLEPGPFAPFLTALHRIQARLGEERSPVRTALVTARGAPAHLRVINTLRAWGVRIDQSFFLAGEDKTGVLQQLRPHLYFDDQRAHLARAETSTPSAQVLPTGAAQPPLPGVEGGTTTRLFDDRAEAARAAPEGATEAAGQDGAPVTRR